MRIEKTTLEFLKKVGKNNNRPWFDKNKQLYLDARDNMQAFLEAVADGLSKTDVIEKHRLWRIYRDVRFSKDKTPYNDYFGASLVRAGARRRGGYCFNVERGNSWVGGGFYNPNKEDLLLIRKEFEFDAAPFRKIISKAKFKKTFGDIQGRELKTAPRGFDKQDPNIDLIRKKSFYFHRSFTDEEVLAKDFLKQTVKTLENIRPYFDYMTEILTADLEQ